MKTILAAAALLVLSIFTSHASDREPKREILGLHLEMTKEEATKRLNEIGTFARDERKKQQIWTVRDDHFSHVIIALDKVDRLRFITAVARADAEARRIRYDAVAPLEQARQAGDPKINNFNFEWTVEAQDGAPRQLVNARGRDTTFLDTLSLKRIEAEESDGKE